MLYCTYKATVDDVAKTCWPMRYNHRHEWQTKAMAQCTKQ